MKNKNKNMDTCFTCNQTIPAFKPGDGSTGYANDEHENKICYACCAKADEKYMIEHGRITLYLSRTRGSYKVTNWPGSLAFTPRYVSKGNHNIAGVRYGAWFTGPQGTNWHGVQYGENTQIIHCRRIKATR